MPHRLRPVFICAVAAACSLSRTAGATEASIEVTRSEGGIALVLENPPVPPVGGFEYQFNLESSTDLEIWTSAGGLTLQGPSDRRLSAPFLPDGTKRFYRLSRPSVVSLSSNPTTAELLGYERVYDAELARVGSLSPEQFQADHEPILAGYLPQIDFDPRQAAFWDAFNADPSVINLGKTPESAGWRSFDFRLSDEELAVFMRNGFVASERLGSFSFADVFYRVFNDDLPVFFSADAALHAWHMSYQRMLEETEETQLAPALGRMITEMREKLVNLGSIVLTGDLAQSVLDADHFLAVTASLYDGGPVESIFGEQTRLQRTLAAIAAEEFDLSFPLDGQLRPFDFSQFRVRGHYERSVELSRYFQTFMWTARADFQVIRAIPAGLPDEERQRLLALQYRHLGTAVILGLLLQEAGLSEEWRQWDDLIRHFVGRPEAMNFAELLPLLAQASIAEPRQLLTVAPLEKLRNDIIRGNYGYQLYAHDGHFAGERLPQIFAVTGQRFVPDGWALAQVSYDRIQWFESIPGRTLVGDVLRRYTSALDVAYGVLGNRHAGLEIGRRMLDVTDGVNFRDGYPYAHNLTAVAATFNQLQSSMWTESIYTRWLAALRALSSPPEGEPLPQALQTKAWAMRLLNTQLASYTELKHDTILYAAQPYAAIYLCDYPAGFIDPTPGFWEIMRDMALAAAEGIEALPASGVIMVSGRRNGDFGFSRRVDLAERKQARVNFCYNFAEIMDILQTLAAKEIRREAFSEDDALFIRGLMNRQDLPYSGASFDGWYPSLFYEDYTQLGTEDRNGSNLPDPLVTDIFTAPPDQIDPIGGVLHEGTGNVDLLMVSVDVCGHRTVYAGPTLSHYERWIPGPKLVRMTDDEWAAGFQDAGERPERPEWTQGYLVPGPGKVGSGE